MQCAAQGVKIRYATQTGTVPLRFILFANRPKNIPKSCATCRTCCESGMICGAWA
jgi:predicted GTPase